MTLRTRLIRFVLGAMMVFPYARQTWAADTEQAHYNAAVVLYNAGQLQAAVTKIDERLKVATTDAWRAKYLFAKGLCHEKAERNSDARAGYRQLVEKYPSAPETPGARTALLYLDYAAGDWESVRKDLSAIDRRNLPVEDRRNVAVMAGESAYQMGDYTNAWTAFSEAISIGADRTALATKMFDCAVRLGRPADILAWTTQPVAGVSSDKLAMIRADACVALGRLADAHQAVAGIPDGHVFFPRAEFIRAQYLIQAGQLSNALPHLETAVRELRDPPLPASVWLALSECRLAAGMSQKALQALDETERRMAALAPADQESLKKQIISSRLRMIGQSGDTRQIVRAVSEFRESIPKDQLSAMLYLRLYALDRESRLDAILESYGTDYPTLKMGADDGPATMIYFKAFTARGQIEQGLKMLGEFIQRKPAAPEALSARIELARVAIDRKEWARVRELLSSALAASNIKTLEADRVRDLRYNLAVAAYNLGQDDEVLRALQGWIGPGTNDAQTVQLQILAGQSAFRKKDYAAAVKIWKAALTAYPVPGPGHLHEQIAMAALAQKDAATVLHHLEQAQAGGVTLSREAEEGWARMLYEAGQFAEAGDRMMRLAKRFSDAPDYAFEAAVALEKAGRFKDAEDFYQMAGRKKIQLSALYSNQVDRALAQLRFAHGLDDRGLSHWVMGLATGTPDGVFNAALQNIAALRTDIQMGSKVCAALAQAAGAYPETHPRHYLIGANQLLSLSSVGEQDRLARELADRFIQNEKSLESQSPGAILAPAIIFFHRGEAARRQRDFAAALADYETVLSAYPCNEWPDAAAYGVAECFAGLGDLPNAKSRLEELAGQTTNAVSAPWVSKARHRLDELKQPKGAP